MDSTGLNLLTISSNTLRYAAACLLHACLLDVAHDLMLWLSLWIKSFEVSHRSASWTLIAITHTQQCEQRETFSVTFILPQPSSCTPVAIHPCHPPLPHLQLAAHMQPSAAPNGP